MSDEIATIAIEVETRRAHERIEQLNQRLDELGGRNAQRAIDGIRKVEGNLDSMAVTAARCSAAIASVFVGSKIAGFAKDIVKAASDLDEAAGQFSHVFRSVRSEAQSMATTLQKEYGRSTKASMAMLTATGDLFVGMGMSQRAALGLSGQIAKLSVDMGSFKNLNIDDVSNAFTSAIMGNTQAVKRLGIALDDETLKAELAKQKKEGLIFASEREAKAQAIVAVAYRQAGNAIGDHARESKKYANQLSTLDDNLGELKEKFGEAFLEHATKIINVLNDCLQWFKTFDESTVKFIARTGLMAGTAATVYGAYKSVSMILKSSAVLQTIAANTSKEAAAASGGEAAAALNKAAAIEKSTQSLERETVAKSANASASSVAKKATVTEITIREKATKAVLAQAVAVDKLTASLTAQATVSQGIGGVGMVGPRVATGSQRAAKVASATNARPVVPVGRLAEAKKKLDAQQKTLDKHLATLTAQGNQRSADAVGKKLATVNTKQQLLANLAQNRQAVSGSGFSKWSNNAKMAEEMASARQMQQAYNARMGASAVSYGQMSPQALQLANTPSKAGVLSQFAGTAGAWGKGIGGAASAGVKGTAGALSAGVKGIGGALSVGAKGVIATGGSMLAGAAATAGVAAVGAAAVSVFKGIYDEIASGGTKTLNDVRNANDAFDAASKVFDNYLGYVWRATGATDALANQIGYWFLGMEDVKKKNEELNEKAQQGNARRQALEDSKNAVTESDKRIDELRKSHAEAEREREERFAYGGMNDRQKLDFWTGKGAEVDKALQDANSLLYERQQSQQSKLAEIASIEQQWTQGGVDVQRAHSLMEALTNAHNELASMEAGISEAMAVRATASEKELEIREKLRDTHERIAETEKRNQEQLRDRLSFLDDKIFNLDLAGASKLQRGQMLQNRFDDRIKAALGEEDEEKLQKALDEAERLENQLRETSRGNAPSLGPSSGTTSAVEASSVLAREMENRMFSNFEANIAENTGKTAKNMEQMRKAYEESARRTKNSINLP